MNPIRSHGQTNSLPYIFRGDERNMLLEGKKGLIVGVANKHSIAWAIAQAAAREGARLAFNYQNERLRENVEELAETIAGAKTFVCDVGDDEQIAALMQSVA